MWKELLFFTLLFIAPLCSLAQEEQIAKTSCAKQISIAKEMFEEESIDELKKYLEKIKNGQKRIPQKCVAEFYVLEGQVSLYNEDFETARINFNDAKKIFQNEQNELGIITTKFAIANSFVSEDDRPSAIKLLDELLTNKTLLEQSGLLMEVLDIRSLLHSSKGEHMKAMSLIKEAASFADSKKDTTLQVQLYNQIATNYQANGKTDSAIFYFNKLIDTKELNADHAGILSDYSTLGGLHQELGNYEEAQKSFIEAIRYSEKLKDTLTLLSTYIDIANVYLDQRLLEPALDYTQKARSLAKEKGALLNEGRSLQLRATIFEYLEQADQALLNYQNAFQIYQQLGLKQDMADIQLRIANLFGSNDNLSKAESTLREALKLRMATGDRLGELNTKLALCEVLFKMDKNLPEAIRLITDAQKIANEVNDANALQEVYRHYAFYHEQTGNYKQALKDYRTFNLMRDSIVNQENAKIVRELEKRYETEKMNRKIAQQESEIEEQLGALKTRNTQIVQLIAGLLVLLIMTFLTVITYQRNKQFAKQKMSVIEKEKETEILRAMVSGEEQERKRIARDLHDGLGAIIATIKLRISALQNKAPEIKTLESYQKAEELIEEASISIREISHNMMPGSLSKYGLEVSLKDLCDAIEESNSLEVSFIPFNLDKIIDDILEINLFRIIQELLKNVIKHAEAKEVIVQISIENNNIEITIEDDGKGFDPTKIKANSGIGLGSIKSRVLYLHGTMNIDSKIGRGTSFNITIPHVENKKIDLW